MHIIVAADEPKHCDKCKEKGLQLSVYAPSFSEGKYRLYII